MIHLWNESTYKIHLLPQVWNEIIADNEQKLGKLGESKLIHMTVNGGDCNVYAQLFAVNAPNPAWSIQCENGLYFLVQVEVGYYYNNGNSSVEKYKS